jgi:hypothetical protein
MLAAGYRQLECGTEDDTYSLQAYQVHCTVLDEISEPLTSGEGIAIGQHSVHFTHMQAPHTLLRGTSLSSLVSETVDRAKSLFSAPAPAVTLDSRG